MPSEFVKEVADVFAKDGPLSKVTANYTPRPSQIEFATSVAEALEQGKSLVAEAGTGTGKTFAYLVPALLKDQKVLISTAGKTLQDQLFTKDIPALLKALGMGCRVALLKGRSNYICKQRLEHALQEDSYVAKSREEVVHLHRIKKFAGQSVTGERGDITDVPENSGIWPEVTSTGENCLGANCDHYNDCFVMQAREKAKEAQLLVINHHLFLADISLKDNQITDFLPEFDLVVLDEAHQLTNIATNFFSQTLNLYDVRNLAADAVSQGYGVNKQIDWNGIYKTISNACDDLISTTHNILNSKDKQLAVAKFKDKHLLVEPFKKLLNAVEKLSNAVHVHKEASPEMTKLDERCTEALDLIEYWRDVFNGKAVSRSMKGPLLDWFTVKPKNIFFNTTPLSYAEMLKSAREVQGKPWVLTSATLAANGDFKHFVDQVGLEDAETKSWESPFDFKAQGMLYITEDLPIPSAPNFSDEVAKRIWPFIKKNIGRAFVLCTTLRAMEVISEALRYFAETEGVSMNILVQNEQSKQELLRRFRSEENSVLVGSMSFWEGVDIKGDALSLVVIDKIPFPPPDDPVFEGRSKELEAEGKSSFNEISIPEAIMLLKQGAGRLIRDEKDEGLLILCDNRLLSKGYGTKIWKSLPDFARTKVFDTAMNFLERCQEPRG